MSAAEQFDVGDAFESNGEALEPEATSFDTRTFSHQPLPAPVPVRRRAADQYTVDEAFPYDARLQPAMQQDLDKLRCLPDRALAQALFEFWEALLPIWNGGTA